MLIQLTGVPHPDLNGGVGQPVFLDASRVLLIIQGQQSYPKLGSIERHREVYDLLFASAQRLAEKVNGYVPDMSDPIAVAWMRTATNSSKEVNAAYKSWAASFNRSDLHPPVDCTEVQLACGTALEHGVMLTRVWVTESPEQVAKLVQRAHEFPEGYEIPSQGLK